MVKLIKEVSVVRDIPMFTTELGIASLTLSQIPYTKTAYIRIQDTSSPDDFLKECVSFCKAAGAEKVYASGHAVCEGFPEHTVIIQMRADISSVADTDAALFPVTEKTLETWRNIYNQKVIHVPNGAWMTLQHGKDLLADGDGYFIHRGETLLGIGKASGNKIHWVASVQPGAGADVLRALCHALTDDTVILEVASTNKKALSLYEGSGFVRSCVLSVWYCVL